MLRGEIILFCSALQIKGGWESNIIVWFRFMYSQKWNCVASLCRKQNYKVLSPNFHIHVSVSDLYIPRIDQHIWLRPNRQTNSGNIEIAHRYSECRNWERGLAVSFPGIHRSDFRSSVLWECSYNVWVSKPILLVYLHALECYTSCPGFDPNILGHSEWS